MLPHAALFLRREPQDVLARAVLGVVLGVGDHVDRVEVGAVLAGAAAHDVGLAVAGADDVVAGVAADGVDWLAVLARRGDAVVEPQVVVALAAEQRVGAGVTLDAIVPGAARDG